MAATRLTWGMNSETPVLCSTIQIKPRTSPPSAAAMASAFRAASRVASSSAWRSNSAGSAYAELD